MRTKLLLAVLVMCGSMLGAWVDSLAIIFFDELTSSFVTGVQVIQDTAVGEPTDTVTTTGTGMAGFLIDRDTEYKYRISKAGSYIADSLVYKPDYNIATAKDTSTNVIYFYLTPISASPYLVNVHSSTAQDTIPVYVESLYVDIVNPSNDTITSGYTDSLGSFGIDPNELTAGQSYRAYVTSDDTSYVANHARWTHKANVNKVIAMQVDAYSAITTNTISATVIDWKGYPVENVVARATIRYPKPVGSGTSTKWITSATSTQIFTSNSSGLIEIVVPDSVWIDIDIPASFGYNVGLFCTENTVLQDVGVQR